MVSGGTKRYHMKISTCINNVIVVHLDDDGKVSAPALGEDVSKEEAAAILATADTDGDGLLDHDDFLGLDGQPEEEEMGMRCLRFGEARRKCRGGTRQHGGMRRKGGKMIKY
ncbi:probable calcium-binding protein CML25/26 [Oryza brachyantha]|uniref:probable calcium-binding protein CML25/26 n=1 Tax=Oryza brachyantha TaxID=4533 RepID=UPI001ADB1583|nr:probable calcium-binding protein CML25/26 [Oryza brachyantha]